MPGYDGVYTNKAGKVAEGCATFWRRSRYRVAARADLNMRQLFAAAASSAAAGPATGAPSSESAPNEHEGSGTGATSGPASGATQPRRPASDAASSAGDGGPARRHARFAPLLRALPHLATTLQQVGTIGQLLVLVPAAIVAAAGRDTGSNGGMLAAASQADHRDGRDGAAEQPSDPRATDAAFHGPNAENPGERSHVPGLQDVARLPAAVSDEEALCVVNTHLFYHPWAPHVRILHVAAMMDEAVALAGSTQRALGLCRRPALLFCGDLNSDLSWGMPGASFNASARASMHVSWGFCMLAPFDSLAHCHQHGLPSELALYTVDPLMTAGAEHDADEHPAVLR